MGQPHFLLFLNNSLFLVGLILEITLNNISGMCFESQLIVLKSERKGRKAPESVRELNISSLQSYEYMKKMHKKQKSSSGQGEKNQKKQDLVGGMRG